MWGRSWCVEYSRSQQRRKNIILSFFFQTTNRYREKRQELVPHALRDKFPQDLRRQKFITSLLKQLLVEIFWKIALWQSIPEGHYSRHKIILIRLCATDCSEKGIFLSWLHISCHMPAVFSKTWNNGIKILGSTGFKNNGKIKMKKQHLFLIEERLIL